MLSIQFHILGYDALYSAFVNLGSGWRSKVNEVTNGKEHIWFEQRLIWTTLLLCHSYSADWLEICGCV